MLGATSFDPHCQPVFLPQGQHDQSMVLKLTATASVSSVLGMWACEAVSWQCWFNSIFTVVSYQIVSPIHPFQARRLCTHLGETHAHLSFLLVQELENILQNIQQHMQHMWVFAARLQAPRMCLLSRALWIRVLRIHGTRSDSSRRIESAAGHGSQAVVLSLSATQTYPWSAWAKVADLS